MAELEGLNLKITASVDNATQGLNTVQKGLAATAVAANKTDSALAGIKTGSDKATFALTNLGRVVQDAPFGFIGIANNINPLLESFQRLKAETGTTGGALKALVSSMTGPAGLGIAVSVISSLLVVFGDKLFSSSKATDELKKASDGYNESAAKEVLKLNELLAVAKDESISRETRLAAVQKLKAEYPSYLKGLSDEQILAGNLGGAYERINQALIAKATLQAAEDKLLPILKQQVELQLQSLKAQQTISGLSNISDTELSKNKETLKFVVQRNQAAQDLVKNSQAEAVIQTQINNLMQQLGQILEKTAPLDLKFKPDKINESTKAVEKLTAKTLELINLTNAGAPSNPGKAPNPPVLPLIGLGDETLNKLNKNAQNAAAGGMADLKKSIEDTASAIQNLLAPAFDAVFSAIESGQNVFKSLGKAVEKLVLDLVKAAIESAILSVILNAIFPGSSSFGGIFGKLSGLGSLIPHAEGGIITRPLIAGNHLFGEAGKEAVIPLDKLSQFIRPQTDFPQYLPIQELRGDSIFLLYKRAAGRFNKNN